MKIHAGDLWIKRDESNIIVFIVDVEKDYLIKFQVIGIESPNNILMYATDFLELYRKIHQHDLSS